MDLEGFGSCSLFGECQEACPKQISIDTIMQMNRDFVKGAAIGAGEESNVSAGAI
jgi:succinate dehydrogenase / fumarate reductase iron-sulfur subunit